MRVTIGERLGLTKDQVKVLRMEKPSDDAVPLWVEPEVAEPVLCFYGAPSATLPFGYPEVREDDGGPARVTGEMIWTHKTAPMLVIHGRDTITPEEYAAGRRR